jgi:N-acetylneuraminic acid mutarotase
MKKKRIAESGLLGLRIVVFCTAACLVITGTLLGFFRSETPTNTTQRTLTFQERVAYQRAIEEVYWRHRIWPKERPDPKPSLDAVMSQAQLERKVHDYQRKSQALQDYWQRPITSEQLQAEMNRLAKHSKQPEVLRELFQALGNDPFVIAECLARPMLAERLFTSALVSQDANRAVSKPTKFRKALFGGFTLPTIPTLSKGEGTCVDDWGATNTVNAPSARSSHTAVWTGSEMVIWGGWSGGTNYFNTGGKYSPSTDSWTATSIANAPSARVEHTAVWTGSEMIVWGGADANGSSNTGGRYNPSIDSWVATPTANAPTARSGHTAVWSGSEMIVWGGYTGTQVLTGGRYNPTTDSWTATSTTNPPTARTSHTAVWTGSEMIVWGGISDSGYLNSGGRYNPGTDSWLATNTSNAPTARNDHTAVWTSNEMIIWGGANNISPYYLNTGGRYNPITDSWVVTSTANAPSARGFHTAIWTASDMIVWGGIGNVSYVNTGGRYNPATDTWTTTSTTNTPSVRSDHATVWTGSEMIVWGGSDFDACQNNQYLNTGGRYCGQYPTPTPTPTPIITVTNTNDSGPGSLRQALADAIDGDTIEFAVTGTVQLTSGELLVDKSIVIPGPGPENLAVNANAKSRVFHVTNPCGNVTISGLTITNGYASGSFPDNSGGGIYNDHAMLRLNNCTILNNSAVYGGGIYNDGENFGNAMLEIDNSLVTDNSGGASYNDGQYGGFASLQTNNSIVSNNSGGGIYNNAQNAGTAQLEITYSTLSNNNDGEAIHSTGWVCQFCGDGTATVQITNSSITDNPGGAIYSDTGQPGPTTVSITNSTISGNAGGVYNSTLSATGVNNSTISDNGSGIYNDVASSGAGVSNSTMSNNGVELNSDGPSINMYNTIFNISPGGHSIVFNGWGTVTSSGYNLSSDDGGGYLNAAGDQINTEPMLGPLQGNGGSTFTHALLPGSPAINAGDPNINCVQCYDQRGPGYDRVRGGRIDIGSFEVQQPPRVTPTPRVRPTPRPRPTPSH